MFSELIRRIALFSLILSDIFLVEADLFIDSERDWKITFYTGDKVWSGTDSIVNVQIYGSTGKSEIMQLIPKTLQMEANSIDRFSIGPLDMRTIGNIGSITISKQHSYAFFNDWELIKVELTDPDRKTYLFICECWLTTLKYKKNIELHSIDGIRIQKHINDPKDLRTRSFSAFPVTVSLLFLFLMLIIFTYFGNLIVNKWRGNAHFFSRNFRRRHQREGNSRIRRANQNNNNNNSRNNNNGDSDKDDEEDEDSNNPNSVYNFTNDLTDVPTNSNLNRLVTRRAEQTNDGNQPSLMVSSLLNEDKPPDYKELFPVQNIPMQKIGQAKNTISDPNT